MARGQMRSGSTTARWRATKDTCRRNSRKCIFAGVGRIRAAPAVRRLCRKMRSPTDGTVDAAWRHVYPGNVRDIAFTSSHDAGRSLLLRVSEGSLDARRLSVSGLYFQWIGRITFMSCCPMLGARQGSAADRGPGAPSGGHHVLLSGVRVGRAGKTALATRSSTRRRSMLAARPRSSRGWSGTDSRDLSRDRAGYWTACLSPGPAPPAASTISVQRVGVPGQER